jgi:glycerol-3-phosphate acyltransferase PlsY
VAAPVAAIVLEEWMYVPALVVIAAIVLVLHRENIARLRAGTEPRIGRK